MECLRIEGGRPLAGSVRVSGAKNAALPIMAASLLAEAPVHLAGVPQLGDVDTLSGLLESLGMTVRRTSGDDLSLETTNEAPHVAPASYVRRMRAAFCVLGPLLARRGRAVVPLPGGCQIGPRPIDLHLKGLAALGAEIRLEGDRVVAQAHRLRGATIDLRGPHGPTVTGTANVLSAAVMAEGETTIHGAACEPEIVDLGGFLAALGADIRGLGTSTLRIRGRSHLGGSRYRIIPDRIEAITLLLAPALAGGWVRVQGVMPEHVEAALTCMRAAGLELSVESDSITATLAGRPVPLSLFARPHPGVPTDVQAQFTAMLCLADGRSSIRDRVFPSRTAHLGELQKMRACMSQAGGVTRVDGVHRLHGARVRATDLRASAALVLAALGADGVTTIDEPHHLDRGYERLDRKLNLLGARIERIDAAAAEDFIQPEVVAHS